MKKLLLTTVLAFIGSVVFAQERIAVFPFEDMDKVFSGNEAVMFYREFSNEFTNKSAGKFSVVPRQEVDKLINTEAAFQLNDFSARAKTAEMQRVLNGTQILSGLIGKLGNNLRITVSLYTYPELQQLPGGTTLSVANKDELFKKVPELVQQMQDIIAGGGTNTGNNKPLSLQEYDNENDFRIIPLTGGKARIIRYAGTKQVVRIPPQIQGMTVTEIGDEAFTESGWRSDYSFLTRNGKEIINITIPDTVTSIGSWAFAGNQLTSVIIPNSVTSIGLGTFAHNKLNSVTIPNSVVSIDEYAFAYNDLISVTIPNSVTSIGYGAFMNNQLTSVTIPSSLTSISGHAFSSNNLTSVTIPNSITFIGYKAFGNNQLTSVTIPNSVTSIEDEAFTNNQQLTSVTIPSSVMSIGSEAFWGCDNLTSVTLSRRTKLSAGAFQSTRITYRD